MIFCCFSEAAERFLFVQTFFLDRSCHAFPHTLQIACTFGILIARGLLSRMHPGFEPLEALDEVDDRWNGVTSCPVAHLLSRHFKERPCS